MSNVDIWYWHVRGLCGEMGRVVLCCSSSYWHSV